MLARRNLNKLRGACSCSSVSIHFSFRHGSISDGVVSSRLLNQCRRIWWSLWPARSDVPCRLAHISLLQRQVVSLRLSRGHIVNLGMLGMLLGRIYRIICRNSRVMVNKVCAMNKLLLLLRQCLLVLVLVLFKLMLRL